VVDGSRQDLLSGAGFALEHDRQIVCRDEA
jgi:hypothetical protein